MNKRPLTAEEALVLGDDFDVGGGIIVRQPTINEVIKCGESSYYKVVSALTAISSDCKASLYDLGLDWCEISDFEMFMLSTRGLTKDDTWLLLGDEIDLSAFDMYRSDETGQAELRSPDGRYVIDAQVQRRMSEFLCRMHQIVKKPEFPANDFAREMLLEESRMERDNNSGRAARPILPSLISFVANVSGSKYDYETCKQLKYSMFMDAVARLQIIGNATALRNACYSGMIDSSKIDKSELNMMREITLSNDTQVVHQNTNVNTIKK